MFKKNALLVLLLAFAVGGTQAATWNIDQAHSSVGFTVRHMVISKITGKFNDFDGTVEFDGEDLSSGKAQVTVRMASVDTDNEKRDDHLRTGDFFEVEKYPTMTFKSTRVSNVDGDKFRLTGILTLKDVSKEVIFDCKFNGKLNDPWGNVRAGFSAETEINRQDFNVSFSKVLDGGGLVVSDNVRINLELELIQAKEQAASGE